MPCYDPVVSGDLFFVFMSEYAIKNQMRIPPNHDRFEYQTLIDSDAILQSEG